LLIFGVLLFGPYKAEAQFGDGVVEAVLFFSAEVASGLLLQHGEEVDVVAAEVEIGLAVFAVGQEAHVEFSLEAEGVDQEIEIGWREFGAEFVVVVGVVTQVVVCFVHAVHFTNRVLALSLASGGAGLNRL
jgi:hypothetical protein